MYLLFYTTIMLTSFAVASLIVLMELSFYDNRNQREKIIMQHLPLLTLLIDISVTALFAVWEVF